MTVRRAEGPNLQGRVAATSLANLRRAMEDAGAEFIPRGVRRRMNEADKAAISNDLLAMSKRARDAGTMTDHDLYDENALPA